MTMYRYITLLWNRTDTGAAKAADYITSKLHEASPHSWRKAWAAPGVTVFDSGEHKGRMQTYCLQDDGGVVLGKLFHKDYTSLTTDFDDTLSRACLKTRGQHLIDNYWGRYVAFLHDRGSGTNYIMRDPSGAFPCFHTPFQGVEIYFSDMQDAANFDFLPFTVNWDHLKTNIILPSLQKIHTGLNEVREVLPAECVEITPFERKSRFVWDPTEIAQTDIVEDPEEAAALLRSTVKSTIQALAGCYDTIIHNLGGLDSSIALACMAQTPDRPEIICSTNYTKSPRGEERRYSRQIAEKYGIELVEWELDYRKADISKVLTSNMLASPLGFFDCIRLIDFPETLAKERGAQALFYGVGGDNVFCRAPYNTGALDYVRCHGLFGKDILKIAMEASRYGRKSLFRTGMEMLRERFALIPCKHYWQNELFADLTFPIVNPKITIAESFEQCLHPLLIPDDRALKGKYLHIFMSALYSIDYYDHWDTNYSIEKIQTYLTQPIIETCLRIPSWVMTYGGIERGLARKSFQNDLPRDNIRRLSKSTPAAFYEELYRDNIDFVRQYLLDGELVRNNVLLRDKLEAVINETDVNLGVTKSKLLGIMATEIWLRRWMERPINEINNLYIAV